MKYRRNRTWLLVLVILLSVGALVLLTRVNLSIDQQLPPGSDFVSHWVSLRTFLRDGANPYGDAAAHLAQQQAYGRLAKPGEDALRFTSPLYAVVVYLPFVLIPDFAMAQAVWMTTLEVALIGLALLSVRLAGWRPGRVGMLVYAIFSLLWFHSAWPLINGDMIILLALAFVGALMAIKSGLDEVAGMLLALTTIKLPVFALALIFVAIWALAHRRTRILAWLFGVWFILVAFALLLMPNWIIELVRQLINPVGPQAVTSLQAALAYWLPAMGSRLGWALTAIAGVILVVEWFVFHRADFRGFYWAVCLTLMINQVIGLPTGPQNFIVLLPALALVFATLEERWPRGGRAISFLSMAALFAGLWVLYFNGLGNGQPQPNLAMFLPLPAYLLVTLYWVRWWAVRPPTVWFDLIYEQENPRR